jgi:hypothetical protein
VYGVRGRRVRYVAVADRSIRRSAKLLIRYHKKAGFLTTRKKHKRTHKRR